MTNLVSNTGIVSTDTTGVGTARYTLAAASYGSTYSIKHKNKGSLEPFLLAIMYNWYLL